MEARLAGLFQVRRFSSIQSKKAFMLRSRETPSSRLPIIRPQIHNGWCKISTRIVPLKKNCFHDSKQIQLTVAVPGARTRLQPYLSSDLIPQVSEPVWSSSKALGLEAEGPRFESASALLSLQKLWSVDIVSRLCSTQLINH